MELLFESRSEIVGRRGRLIPFQATAKVSADPILEAAPNTGFALYGTVIQENGGFRMWHQTAPSGHAWEQDISLVGVAESSDGLTWREASYGAAGNLTNLGLHSPSIIKRGDGYLATGCWKRSVGANPEITEPGYYLATSRDGVDWRIVKDATVLPGGDVITGIWDERVGRNGIGRACYKYLRYHGGVQRRALFESTFTEQGWGSPRLILMPGEADDIAALGQGYRSADYYGMTMMPSGRAGMLGFVWMFYHQPPYFKSGSGMFGGSALVLAYRETPEDAWVFASGRRPFLEHPSAISQKPFFYAASSVLSMENEQLLYCTAFNRGHGATLNEDRKREPEAIRQLQAEGLASIHLAKWKKDRFFGFRAETEADLVLNLGPITKPSKLLLNYDAGSHGWIKVSASVGTPQAFVAGFSPIPSKAEAGFTLEDCHTLTGDECSSTVRWSEGFALPVV